MKVIGAYAIATAMNTGQVLASSLIMGILLFQLYHDIQKYHPAD